MPPGWTIKPASDDPADIEIAEFVEDALTNIKGTVSETLKEILSAMDYGYSISEIVWKLEELGDYAGKITIDQIKSKKPHFYRFDADEYGNLKPDGLLSNLFLGADTQRLPVDKFIIYSYQQEFSNHYGRSDLREAYRSWWSKDNIIKFWNIFLERFGSPLAVGKYMNANPQRPLRSKRDLNQPPKIKPQLLTRMAISIFPCSRRNAGRVQIINRVLLIMIEGSPGVS